MTDPRSLASLIERTYGTASLPAGDPRRLAVDTLRALVEERRVLQINVGAALQSAVEIARKYEALLGLLREARDDVAEIAAQQGKPHRIREYRQLLCVIDAALRGEEKSNG